MDTLTEGQQTAVKIDIDDILHLDKWKRSRPILEGIIGSKAAANQYKRNEWIVIYKATDGRIGTMATIEEIKDINKLRQYLEQFSGLTVKS